MTVSSPTHSQYSSAPCSRQISAAVIVAGWRYYLHLGVMESRGGVTMLWIGFAIVYDLAGRTGVLCLACLIGIGFWWLAAVGLKKLRSAR